MSESCCWGPAGALYGEKGFAVGSPPLPGAPGPLTPLAPGAQSWAGFHPEGKGSGLRPCSNSTSQPCRGLSGATWAGGAGLVLCHLLSPTLLCRTCHLSQWDIQPWCVRGSALGTRPAPSCSPATFCSLVLLVGEINPSMDPWEGG